MGSVLGLITMHPPREPGRDGFHSVPDFLDPSSETNSRDAVERVPTGFMGSDSEEILWISRHAVTFLR